MAESPLTLGLPEHAHFDLSRRHQHLLLSEPLAAIMLQSLEAGIHERP